MTSEVSSSTQPSIFVYERIDTTDSSLDWLATQGFQVRRGRAMWDASYSAYSDEEIIAEAQGFTAVMGASGAHFSARVLEQLPHLRFISKFGIGVDNIDLAASARQNIVISNSPDDLAIADVAEHTIALILALRKNLAVWNTQYLRAGGWRPGHTAQSLQGCTLGIIGFGRIGRAVATRLLGWDMRILAFDPDCQSMESVTLTDLPTLLRESDIVSLHAKPSESSRHLIDAAAISLMKHDSILINTGRASLVDSEALYNALRTTNIAGAAIDVFDVEPPPRNYPLLQCSNVIATPHVASWTRGSLSNIGWKAARNLHAMMLGIQCANIVNLPSPHLSSNRAEK